VEHVVDTLSTSEDERQLLISNGVSSMWQKGNLDRERLIAHIDAQLEWFLILEHE